MLLSLQWLREFVPYEGTTQDLADRLTMIGNEVEEIFNPFKELESIVVGHVVECGKHPDADKLSLCKVDAGGEILQVVCGAPNVAKDQYIAMAKVGTVLPDGTKLKKSKIRGIESQGMICSERELGLTEDHTGIMVLDGPLTPGQRLIDALNLETEVLDIGVTPNRADCLSVLGLARDTAVAFNLPVNMPYTILDDIEAVEDRIDIEIPEPEYCPLYMARVIKGVTIKPSPQWMKFRLLSVGLRPISNIVDVTNYVLMELGQPLHAFDKSLLAGGKIRVARASNGMEIVTLDGQTRKLLDSDLLIWDGEKPVALAGVMGGENSEMNDDSTDVVLESAIFRPGTIRKTARRLALPSDASYRFERGVDQMGTHLAMDRAAGLMAELSGGTIAKGYSKNEPIPFKPRTLPFRLDKCNALLGIDLTPEFCKTTFVDMACKVDDADAGNWKVDVPSFRLDLEREVDLYEEAARIYGMDRIPATIPRTSRSDVSEYLADSEYGFLRRIKNWGSGIGLNEAINYSFVGETDLNIANLPEEGRIMIANPLSEDQNVMRPDLIPGLLVAMRNNLAKGNNSLRLFEVAKTFHPDETSDTKTREQNHLALLMTGARYESEWPHKAQDADYLDVKGVVEHFLEGLKIGPASFVLDEEEHPYLSPCVKVVIGEELIGRIGMVIDDVASEYNAKKPVWVASLNLETVRRMFLAHKIEFKNLHVYPPVRRDMTIVGPKSLSVGEVLENIYDNKSKIFESAELIDMYYPEGQDESRNLTFRVTYRSGSKTLKDKEVDKQHNHLKGELEKKLGISYS